MIFLHLIILQKMEFTQGQYYLKVRQIVSTSLYVYSLSNRANLYQTRGSHKWGIFPKKSHFQRYSLFRKYGKYITWKIEISGNITLSF